MRNTFGRVRSCARYGSCAASSDRRKSDCRRPWKDDVLGGGFGMSKNAYMVIYFVLMVAAIVAADILFFRNHFLARLIANIAIVAVFAAVYFLFLRNL
jgi:hypothetical protein